MADNVVLNSGSGGATCAADDVGPGVLYQRVKVCWGADGVANDANASTPLPVTVASTTSITPGTAAANLGKAEDAASADGDVGVGAIAIRKATPANTSSADGDYEFLQMSAGRLWTSAVIDTALPSGTNPIGKLAANSGVTIGAVEVAAAQTLANVTTVGTITNVVHVDDNAASLTVDNGGTFAVQATIAAGATTIGKAEDVASADADVGVPAMAIRKATPANTSNLDGDYEMLQMSAGRLWASANIDQINGVTPLMGNGASGTGAQRVTIANDSTGVLATVSTVTSLTQMNGQAIAMGTGVRSAGTQRVTIATDDVVPASQSGTWTVQPGNTANTTAWLVQDVAGTAGGMSFNGFVGAASNNKTQIKGSAGTLYLISVQNLAATPVYLKVFDKTSANVTAGTTTCDYQFMIPGNTAGAGIVLDSTKGIAHANGITIMLTAGIATNDNTSVSANNQVVTIGYK